jgi:predicted negative regulator of RcsB-dependent stress response
MVTQIELRCAAIALDRGEMPAFVAGTERALKLARENDDAETPAITGLLLARVDMANGDFARAEARLREVIRYFAEGEVVPSEAEAQGLAAICYAALKRSDERDRAAARARELRSAITIRGSAAVVDTLLARLAGIDGQASQAAARLTEIAGDAKRREWTSIALEARLSALQIPGQAHDAAAAAQLRAEAGTRGFRWVIARLASTPGA